MPPSIQDLLNNPICSSWLRAALQTVMFGGREPSEAARDARLLAEVLEARAVAFSANNALDYYDGQAKQMVDLELPLVEGDRCPKAVFTAPLSPRLAAASALRA